MSAALQRVAVFVCVLISPSLFFYVLLCQLVAAVGDPSQSACAEVDCGLFGLCVRGSCTCAEGYSGPACAEAPTPVPGTYSVWSEWSPCTSACGGGTTRRSRVCTPPAHGGAPCDALGPAVETVACGTRACGPADAPPLAGGFGPWTAWSACEPRDPGACDSARARSVVVPGTTVRTRACDAPLPRNGGAACAGAEEELAPCDAVCVPPAKRCPGSSQFLASQPNPFGLPAVQVGQAPSHPHIANLQAPAGLGPECGVLL